MSFFYRTHVNIIGNTCVLIFPIKKVRFKVMAEDYKNIFNQVDKLCILVFENITTYDKKKCKELNIKFFDISTGKSNVKIR